MIVHSDSEITAVLAVFFVVGSFIGLLAAAGQMLLGRFRSGAMTFASVVGVNAVYVFAVLTVSWLSPQKVVSIGDSYCADIWCIGIEKVSTVPLGQNTQYNVGVRIFSDANTVTVSAKGVSLYLFDDRGRRFPLIDNPAAVRYDVSLQPGQSINTSLTFVTSSDARQLYLTGENNGLKQIPFLARLFVSLYIGADSSLMHKPTVLRVL